MPKTAASVRKLATKGKTLLKKYQASKTKPKPTEEKRKK